MTKLYSSFIFQSMQKPRISYFFALIALIFACSLTGCISHKLEQEKSLTGDLFRSDQEGRLPHELQEMIYKRRRIYEDVNDVNFILLKEEKKLSDKKYEELLDQRWELMRVHRQNEIRLEQYKELVRTKPQDQTQGKNEEVEPRVKKGENRHKLMDDKAEEIVTLHKEFMKKGREFKKAVEPYKPGFLSYFI